jgi:hypothetical protein
MTYLEIIEWLENHIVGFTMQLNGMYRLEYLDDEGYVYTRDGVSLEGLVLGINNTYLIN